MAQSMASIVLPSPPSWYPGHMRQFMRMLPALLSRTDVVLELRDARLPLTSINGTFEGMIAIYLLLIRGSFFVDPVYMPYPGNEWTITSQ